MAGWAAARHGPVRAASGSEESMIELAELASSANAEVVGSALQHSPEPDPATLLGRGKVNEVRAEAHAANAATIIFDHDLTPTQLRNLENLLGLKVIDRTQLILDIFASRARTREGKLQVELAQLNYLLPRLAGRGVLLSRLGGGIGTRGPGEQQLEFDRRRIRARIQSLRRALERVRAQRALHRAYREERSFLTVALVGYTNAGKSTLFNALTHAGAVTSSRLFATLDPAVRLLKLESQRPVLLSDTVGFIRHLPPHLVAAFRATLEELEAASLLLHVTDASHHESDEQDAAVESQLESLGLGSKPRLHVWNKIDLLDAASPLRRLTSAQEVGVSARTGEGTDRLLERIDARLGDDPVVEADFVLSTADGKGLALLHRCGKVLETRFEADQRVRVRARLRASLRAQFLAAHSDWAVYPNL